MNEGFILSNKYRRAVFNEFISGETNINRIAKKNRIILTIVKRVVEDFIKEDILEKNGNSYKLTQKGKKLVESIG